MTPRSYLYVPGDRTDMLARALERGADAVIVDLEDAVPETGKEAARSNVARWLAERPGADLTSDVWVRVNNRADLMAADLAAVVSVSGLSGISIPKAEDPDALEDLGGVLPAGLRIIPLIETARGLLAAVDIARVSRVARLAVGEADLAAELGLDISVSDADLLPLRLQIVVASAAAGLVPPVGPVATDFRDLDALRRSTRELSRLGFGARSAIHPDQVPVINDVFTPSEKELERAGRIVDLAEAAARSGSGVFVDDDGRMVDEAVVRGARRILERRRGNVSDPRRRGGSAQRNGR